MNLNDILTILPPLILVTGGLVLLMVDLAIPREKKTVTAWLSIAVLVIVIGSLPMLAGQNLVGFTNMTALDGYALFLDGLFAIVAIVTVLLTLRYNQDRGIMRGEFYPLLMFSASGMMLMGGAAYLASLVDNVPSAANSTQLTGGAKACADSVA